MILYNKKDRVTNISRNDKYLLQQFGSNWLVDINNLPEDLSPSICEEIDEIRESLEILVNRQEIGFPQLIWLYDYASYSLRDTTNVHPERVSELMITVEICKRYCNIDSIGNSK